MIRLANHSVSQFGSTDRPEWIRTVVDQKPDHAAFTINGVLCVRGRRCGLNDWIVDVLTSLAPGERKTLNLSEAKQAHHRLLPLMTPDEALVTFGGPMCFGRRGVPREMAWVDLRDDGAARTGHMRQHYGPLVVDVFFTHYPDRNGWMRGELIVTHSYPPSTELVYEVQEDLELTFGDGFIFSPVGAVRIARGERFADGQARVLPFVVFWPRLGVTPGGVTSFFEIGAVGIERLNPEGRCHVAPGFDVGKWMADHITGATLALVDMRPPRLGCAPRMRNSGEQEDQWWHDEPLHENGVGAEQIVYFTALKWANYPCHHLEADGSHLDLTEHPQLRFDNGRPHWHRGVSPDRHGKPTDLREEDVPGGWWFGDTEHFMFGRVYEAARLKGSPACQWLLQHYARLYMRTQTWEPGLSTSQPYASRAIFYEMLAARRLFHALEDRELAGQVQMHLWHRWDQVLRDALQAALPFLYDGYADLNPPRWCPWQQALCAWALGSVGIEFGLDGAHEIGWEAARAVLQHGLFEEDGTWKAYDSTPRPADGTGDRRNTYFQFGIPAAARMLLDYDPRAGGQEKSVWAQAVAGANEHRKANWLPPVTP